MTSIRAPVEQLFRVITRQLVPAEMDDPYDPSEIDDGSYDLLAERALTKAILDERN